MILILAGTTEGRALAELCAEKGLPVIASLAGATADPRPYPVPLRVGSFGGADGFLAYLRDNGIRAVVDATHPFAQKITERTADLCREIGIPYLRFERPGWVQGDKDNWTWVEQAAEAAALIPPTATVFLATGRQSLPEFSGLTAGRVLVRVVDPPQVAGPIQNINWIVDRGPFDYASEVALFIREKVDVVVTKDAGGSGARAKLDAARDLGIPVILLRRPAPPDAPMVQDIGQAMEWITRL